jgi:Mor family transcriptional regulator
LYKDLTLPERPLSEIPPLNESRNQASYDRYMAGERAVDLAKEFGVSVRRINKLFRRIQLRKNNQEDWLSTGV